MANRFLCKVSKDGRPSPVDVGLWSNVFAKLRNKYCWLTVEGEHERRSNEQNRRHWGRIVPTVQEFLNRKRAEQGAPPLCPEQVHYVLVAAFVGCEETPSDLVPTGPPVPVESKKLSKAAFSKMDDEIEGYYIREHKLVFPDPDDAVDDAGQ